MAGENQIVEKPIDGDLMIGGGQVKIAADVKGDAYIAGGQIDISGTIDGNLIVAGGNITISGKVLKNVIVGGGQVRLDSQSDIGGYVLLGAGKADLLGHFAGPVKLGAGDLVIGEKATFDGNLEADVGTSNVSATSKILGEKNIRVHETKKDDRSENMVRPVRKAIGIGGAIFSFLTRLVLLLVLVKLLGQQIIAVNPKDSFWSTLGLGLVVLIVTPPLALILLATFIGMSLSGIIFSGYLMAISLSSVVTSILLGDYFVKKNYLKTKNLYLQGTAGLALLTLVGLIPLVGGLLKFVVLLFGLGIIYQGLKLTFAKNKTIKS